MKKLILVACLVAAATAAEARGGGFHFSGGSHSTRAYVRSNGTFVKPSGATNPNRTQIDNYSSKGNVNPYSGAIGTKTPRY